MKKRLAVLLSLAVAAGAIAPVTAFAHDDVVVVGSKDFTESIILGEIYALALEEAGVPVERQMQIGSQIIHDAIVNDEIDVYPEYTGTGLLNNLKMDPIYDPEECYETVKAEYDTQFGLTWLDHSSVNDSEGLAMPAEKAEELGIKTISEAWAHAEELVIAGNGEFYEAAAVYPHLREVYGEVEFKEEKTLDHNLCFTAAKSGEVDLFNVYTTEGSLAGGDFVVLEDDLKCWPPYYISPVMRNETVEAFPEAVEIINKVTATFTDENVIGMCAMVDIDGEDYEDVAIEYYESIADSL